MHMSCTYICVRPGIILYITVLASRYCNNKTEIMERSRGENNFSEWIRLNVGGKIFLTTRATLCSNNDGMLCRMFNQNNDINLGSSRDETGAYLIDRNARFFEPILDYLRHGKLIVNPGVSLQGVLEEANFFNYPKLVDELSSLIAKNDLLEGNGPMDRKAVQKLLISATSNPEYLLRFQGADLSGCDLSCLDLSHCNFKYCNLSQADLSKADVSLSCFQWANLSDAKLDGAQLMGIRMNGTNLEKASLKNCNFEDPSLKHTAVLEGANLKGANLEGSQMATVNMRLANLKNAALTNCQLRRANLAGADLQGCILSGSDLQEVNLRGANLSEALFEGMVTPLHMSQAL